MPNALDLGCHWWSRRTARRRVADSLRASGGEPAASTTASTHTLAGKNTLPPCRDPRLSLRIELSGKAARIVASTEDSCRFPALEPALTIKDRTGNTLVELAQPPVRLESLRLGMPQSVLFRLPTDMAGCREGGPFLAQASLGPYPVRRRFSGSLIDCRRPRSESRIKRGRHGPLRPHESAAAIPISMNHDGIRTARRSKSRLR